MSYTVWPDGPTGDMMREVYEERARQVAKFGDQDHLDECDSLAVLAEEFGEASKDVVEIMLMNNVLTTDPEYLRLMRNLRIELIQTAAVACAFAERLERNNPHIYKHHGR